MRHGSLFSGIGGFDLASQWMGWQNIFQVEKDLFCRAVLTKNFPNTNRYDDIKTFDGTKYRGTVDIITGGFPCQPFSTAGKRKGTDDDRYLWPEMLRVIREIQPSYVVGENVSGITNWDKGVVFDSVQSDLEAEGYEVLPFLLPACAINAPHRRDRVWFIAYSSNNGCKLQERCNDRPEGRILQKGLTARCKSLRCSEVTSNSNSQQYTYRGYRTYRGEACEVKSKRYQWERVWNITKRVSTEGASANTPSFRWIQSKHWNESKKYHQNREGNAWQNFPTQSPIRVGDDGIPSRLVRSSLHAAGNAIVPQIAFEIFKAIESIA